MSRCNLDYVQQYIKDQREYICNDGRKNNMCCSKDSDIKYITTNTLYTCKHTRTRHRKIIDHMHIPPLASFCTLAPYFMRVLAIS